MVAVAIAILIMNGIVAVATFVSEMRLALVVRRQDAAGTGGMWKAAGGRPLLRLRGGSNRYVVFGSKHNVLHLRTGLTRVFVFGVWSLRHSAKSLY